ncbi:MAG: type VI secretion system baseplate subunit TssG [Proteobacteria bacterium]|nr:type VI secretion system baseplate subunit TssG [Pseudomonadota bacterium]
MRASQRQFGPSLIEHSQQEPAAYEFFQLVRTYELLFRKKGGDPVSERILFRNSLRLGFAPSQIDGISISFTGRDSNPDIERIEITPGFIGMLGVSGTLPLHYTERVIERERHGPDVAGRAFLDIFVNRAVGHFYRAWKKYKLPYLYETDRRNHFLPQLLSLLGLGQSALRERLHRKTGQINDESLAFFAGLLRQRPVSASTLRQVLGAYFQADVAIEQFVGRWYEAPAGQRSALGGCNAVLGVNTLLGDRVWQRNLRIRIHIRSLSYERYVSFLPSGDLAVALGRLLGFATGGQFECEVCLQLRAPEVRPAGLGVFRGGRLGYDTFLRSRVETCDRGDLRFLVHCSD